MRIGTLYAILACLALPACSDVTPFERPQPYEFSIDCSTDPRCGPEAGNLKLIFRWPRASLPVRIWVEPSGELPNYVLTAARAWIATTIYGELRAVIVADSQTADALFRWGEPREVQSSGTSAARQDCLGNTFISVQLDTTITLPFRSFIHPRLGATSFQRNRCYPIAVAHELGHVLGLFLDSDDPGDLMYLRPQVEGPSARDRTTFSTLYHTAPTVGLPLGR